MSHLLRLAMWACFFPCLLCLRPAGTAAADSTPAGPPLALELNKLEPVQGGAACRVYFVLSNGDDEPVAQLRLDLILFGADGVIARRLAFDLGPLPPKRTAVRLFDVDGLRCEDIGRVLVNGVLACRSGAQGDGPADQQQGDQQHEACLDRLAVSSRAKAPLTK